MSETIKNLTEEEITENTITKLSKSVYNIIFSGKDEVSKKDVSQSIREEFSYEELVQATRLLITRGVTDTIKDNPLAILREKLKNDDL